MSKGTKEAYAAIKSQIDALVDQNTKLGGEIDALRDKRRALKSQIIALEGKAAVLLAAESNPAVLGAVVPGATVEISGEELLRLMTAKHG